MSGDGVLTAEGLRVRYGGRTVLAVDRVELGEGELLAVLGPNGAGKSTLMRVLALLETPERGRVTYRGRDGRAAERALRREASAVFQRPHLWAGSVADNVGLGLRLDGVDAGETRRRVERWAGTMGLAPLLEREAKSLSAGETQRVALARALVRDPRVLFLDEPAASLDAETRAAVHRDLERFARRGDRATLLVTHDRHEAFQLADRIVVLREGRVVRSGRPSELYENPDDPYIAEVTGAELSLAGEVRGRRGGLLEVDVEGTALLATGAGAPGDRVRLRYRPEDLMLAEVAEPDGPAPSPVDPGREARDSVRNTLRARIEEVREVRGLVRIRLSGPAELVAVVTRGSADLLDLRPGLEVGVRVKAAALHAFPVQN